MNDRGIREWRCIGNRTGPVYSMMMMLLRQPVSPRAVGARCGKISLFYEWKSLSCLSVCVLVGRNSESIPTVTLNHRGCSKRRRNATVQRRRINRREYVLLIRMENFQACKTVAFIFRLKVLRYSKCNLVLILFLVWFQLWSVRMRYLKAERNFRSDYQKKIRVILLEEKSRSNLKIVLSFEIDTIFIHDREWKQSDQKTDELEETHNFRVKLPRNYLFVRVTKTRARIRASSKI